MLKAVLEATYTTADVAYSLQYSSFPSLLREAVRNNELLLDSKRNRKSGPGGGNYTYSHIVELLLRFVIGPRLGCSVPKEIFRGVLCELRDSPDADRVVKNPEWFFGSGSVSRDVTRPAVLVYRFIPNVSVRIAREDSTYTLSDVHRCFADGQPTDHIACVNLTAWLNQIDFRLEARLKCRLAFSLERGALEHENVRGRRDEASSIEIAAGATERVNLSREEASAYLMDRYGMSFRPATLAKYVTTGGGPKFYKVKRIPIYPVAELDRWATVTLGPLGSSSSEHRAARQVVHNGREKSPDA